MLDLLRLATLLEDLARLASRWWGWVFLVGFLSTAAGALWLGWPWFTAVLAALITYAAAQLVDLRRN
jgi:Zn-dependent membrane protease YugP